MESTKLVDLTQCRVFPLRYKTPTCKWKDVAIPWSEYDFTQSTGYGMIADDPIAVIDFDEDKSRAVYPEGCFSYFCALDHRSPGEVMQASGMVKTPHGYHLIVHFDKEIAQGQGFRMPDGAETFVDIRAMGRGYIVGPGATILADGTREEKRGTPLYYRPLFQDPKAVPVSSLQELLPTLYRILTTQQQQLLEDVPPSSSVEPAQELQPTSPGGYNGRSNWIPRNWQEGMIMLRSAPPGCAHGTLAGVCRFAWRYRNHPSYERFLGELRQAAADRRIPPKEVEDAIRDFIETHRTKDQETPEPITTEDGREYILTAKGEVRECEYNIRLAVDSGAIKTDDFVVDARGGLVHVPTRQTASDNDALDTISQGIMVDRIDLFLRGSRSTRSQWLPAVVRELRRTKSEPLAPDFIASVKADGPIVSVRELCEHMCIGGDFETATRWVEVCLAQAWRRILHPGAPLENILVLYGPQRTRKSSFIPTLFDPSYIDPVTGSYAAEWSYTDTLTGDLMDDQAVGQRVQGKFCLELPEMTAFRRTRDVGSIRDVITRTHDSYRAPYAPAPVKQPRTCTLVATSNELPMFGDQYGSRRFCPVYISAAIDTEWIFAHRIAIWRGIDRMLATSPSRAVLTDEENARKEARLEPNTYSSIVHFSEICDALSHFAESSSETLTLSQIMGYMTTDPAGPKLRSDNTLKTNIIDVMRHLGAHQRSFRYISWAFTAPVRRKLELWMTETSSDDPTEATHLSVDDKDAKIARLEAELAALKRAKVAPLSEVVEEEPQPGILGIERIELRDYPQQSSRDTHTWFRRGVTQLDLPYDLPPCTFASTWQVYSDGLDFYLRTLDKATGDPAVIEEMKAQLKRLKSEASRK